DRGAAKALPVHHGEESRLDTLHLRERQAGDEGEGFPQQYPHAASKVPRSSLHLQRSRGGAERGCRNDAPQPRRRFGQAPSPRSDAAEAEGGGPPRANLLPVSVTAR